MIVVDDNPFCILVFRVCEDKTQQAGLLKRCVECWSTASGEADNHTVQKLTEFVKNQDSLSWGQIVDIMQKGNICEKLILQLCQELLLGDLEESGSPSWIEQKDVLMKYVMITSNILKDKQVSSVPCLSASIALCYGKNVSIKVYLLALKDCMQSEMQRILDWKEKAFKQQRSTRARSTQPISSLRERQKPFFLRKKFVASLIFCVTNLIESQNIIFRLGRVLPALYMLNTNHTQ